MMQFSSIPFLMVAVSAFPYLLARNAYANNFIDKAQCNGVAALSLLLFAWGVISAFLAYEGFYSSPEFFSAYPGLWFPFIPLVVAAIPLLIFPRLRHALDTAGKVAPLRWFVYFQVLRVAAIGTAIKTYQGEFPWSVELWVGIPDLLFGLSAIAVAWHMKKRLVSRKFWFAWHAIGAGIILVLGMVVINMSLPGAFQVWAEPPTFEVAMQFPMALAPSMIVPLLVTGNLWAIYVMVERKH